MKPKVEQELFSESETARKLGVSKGTVQKWRLKGYLEFLVIDQTIRYTREGINKFIDRFRQM